MKVRRRMPSGWGPFEWIKRLNPLPYLRARRRAAAEATPTHTPPNGAPHSEESPGPIGSWLAWFGAESRSNARWLYVGSFGGAVMVGYAIAAFLLFPAPFFSSLRSVPFVIGMSEADASEALVGAGMRTAEPEVVSHPSTPSGHVVWQDPPAELLAPEGTIVSLTISNGPQRIPMPDVVGYEGMLARRLIEAAGLTYGGVDSIQWAAPRGVTVNTRPAGGSTVRPGTPVVVIVSQGAPTIAVPDVRGLSLEEAADSLTAAGLSLGTSWAETSRAQPPGFIFRQDPRAGTLTAPETHVNVVLARERNE